VTDTGSPRYPDDLPKSAALYEEALAVMPGGNTRTTVFRRPYPVYARSGSGSRVTDVDGVVRVDFLNNYTALIHGHSHPVILERVIAALHAGSSFGLPTESEIRLAEIICNRVSSCDTIRFTNSGSEAVMMAVKAARAYTGRSKIAKCEGVYHGSYDYVEVSLDPSEAEWGDASSPTSVPYSEGTPPGVLADVVVLPFNDPESASAILNGHDGDLAAVVLDPLPNRVGLIPASREFIGVLRDYCSRTGTVLIADEVISFRIGFHGAQRAFDFEADLTTFGKVIGGGFAVGAVGGQRDIMSVFDPTGGRPRAPHGGTFNANPISMSAGIASMELLTPAAIDELNRMGDSARARIKACLDATGIPWQVSGRGSLFRIVPTPLPLTGYRSSREFGPAAGYLTTFTAALLNNGVLLDPGGLGCVSTVMTDEDLDLLESAVSSAIQQAHVPGI
jgi:glutamate-1-semialdehyde 2,1-aminomutase